MKKVYITISALLFCANVMMAQAPSNRTSTTVIADVLAQMPAQKQAEYNQLIKDLATTGEEGVLTLVKRINAPGKGSNAHVDYALSGLSHYVMAKGEESSRAVVAKAYIKALEQVSERETKAFIIRQLQIVGQDESVDALAGYLNDPELSGPAARALAAIGTSNAENALVAGLIVRMGTNETKRNIIMAIADERVEKAEPALKALLGSEDQNTRKDVLYALSRVGTASSLNDLAQAAEQAGFTMENTGANEAYIALIKRIAANGDSKTAEKAANTLLKKATKAGTTQTREAALQILMGLDQEEGAKLLMKALKDKDKNYRNAALNFASDFADQALYVEVAKLIQKAKPEVQVDIVNWLGRESKRAGKQSVIKNLDIRFDLPLRQVLIDLLAEKHPYEVREAATWTLVKIGDKAVISNLAELLKAQDEQIILLGEDALAAFPGDIDQAVAKAIPSATPEGKIAGLQLLALRMADANLNTVLEQIKSDDAKVKEAAYTALKDVVTEKDFTQLCGMLESAESTAVAPIQQAIVAAISKQSPATQVENVSRRMIQAGSAKKHLYYMVLSATGEPKALEMIVAGLSDSNSAAKDAALGALLAWKGYEAAEQLFNICKSNPSDQVFDKALNRYVELVSAPTRTGENRLLDLRDAMEIARTNEQKANILKQIQKTNTFQGLLYASKFLDASDQAVKSAAAYAVANIAMANPNYTGDNVKAFLNRIMGMLDGEDARYEIDAIKTHLGKMADETGFVSIFNGKDLTGWKGLVENPIARAKMKPAQLAKAQEKADENMRRDWKVENGLLVFDGKGYDNLCTVKQYGDFEMYVDWMLDPKGPEADAGIYLRGTPQVQIWDTARVNVGAQVGSGGLYNNQVNESKPSKVADNKLGKWNSFYIKMVGDRVTVVLNGEKVVDNVILENYWDRKLPIFPIEQIELQAHGSKVYYRDIYIKELKSQEPFVLSDEEKKAGFKVLFDGTNMHEWTGNTTDYVLEDGCISCVPSKSFGGNLYTKNEYANFIYRFEFQLTPGANNGVGIRTPLEGDAAYVGMEVQVLDCENPIYKDITPLQHHGSVYGILPSGEKHKEAMKPVGEWNTEEIMADGDHIRVTLNGVVIVDGNIRDAVKNGTPDGKEHPGLFNKKGHIGFLGHGSPVKFRNIRIKELK